MSVVDMEALRRGLAGRRPRDGESLDQFRARREDEYQRKYGHIRDESVRRTFVYHIRDTEGTVIYVGRSVNPESRWRAHQLDPTKDWVADAASFSKAGPYSHRKSCEIERAEIERLQPRGNVMFTQRRRSA